MKHTFLKSILLTCSLLLSLLHLAAQGLPPLSPQAEISLITVSPGEQLYSMYGHSAIRVNDPGQGIDYVFNYGTFDFNTPNFYVKFVRGKLPYQLSVAYFEDLQQNSIRDNRSVVEQVLNLSAQEKQKVVDFLTYNYRPENRAYLYDFFFDNCATRIRDVFKRGLGEALQFRQTPAQEPLSFRQLVGIYQQPHPWVDLGIDLVMGLPADAQASPWQVMFLPDYLLTQFEQARVNRQRQQPFVKETRLLFRAPPRPAPGRLQGPTLAAWVLLVVLGAYTLYQVRKRTTGHTPDILLFGLTGLLGFIVLFLWFGTDHKAFANNLNFLWAFPLNLPFAFFLFRQKKSALTRAYFSGMAVLAALIVLSWPVFPQQFHPAVLPLVLLLALRAWYVARKPAPRY